MPTLGEDFKDVIAKLQQNRLTNADTDQFAAKLDRVEQTFTPLQQWVNPGGLSVPSITAGVGIPIVHSQEKIITSADSVATVTMEIPPLGRHIVIIALASSVQASANFDFLNLCFNGDTASNYNFEYFQAIDSTLSGGSDGSEAFIRICPIPAADHTTGAKSSFFAYIPHYNNAANTKSIQSIYFSPFDTNAASSTATAQIGVFGGGWSGTAPIRSITFKTDTTANFGSDSVFSVYLLA